MSAPPSGPPAFGAAEREEASWLVDRALREDLPAGDITSDTLFPPGERGRPPLHPDVRLEFVPREEGVLCGLPVVRILFESVDPEVRLEGTARDGDPLRAGTPFLAAEGPAGSLLRAERTALNFLQRLSGIASTTAAWRAELDGSPAVLLDTRKTTPGWRSLEKYAVRAGGGTNHRRDLSSGFLLKDNHAAILRSVGRGDVAEWVAALRKARPGVLLEVEVDSREEFTAARRAGADAVLLDNFPLAELRWAVEENRRLPGAPARLEASGGVRRERLREIAATGVDRISAGLLTHSVRALDIGLDWIPDPAALARDIAGGGGP